MHVLEGGATPWDSYSYASQLIDEWSIDGTVLRFDSGNYMVYSCQRTGLQSLCIAPLTSPTTIGAASTLSQPTLSWETQGEISVNEGPAAMYHGGKTYLAFSASYCWSPSYQLGLLTWDGSGDPTDSNSWTKTGPVFSSANGNYGTGHNGFFLSPDGSEIWNVYHATSDSHGNCAGNRYTAAEPVTWNADGSPDFGTAEALGTTMEGPSGE
ncbi:Arabinanase/levansucrase/invertase [Hortaea werneckii]|nr:Arabinanase/levansucrase/invertase [Hortaea werneckii]